MSTDDIGDYFNQKNFKIKKIFWLNDFSCVIEFDNESSAIEAYQNFTGCSVSLELIEKENFDWRSATPFYIKEEPQELSLRVSEKEVYDYIYYPRT